MNYHHQPHNAKYLYGILRDFITDDLEEPQVQNDEEGITKVYFKNTLLIVILQMKSNCLNRHIGL